ncbi:MAG: quinolinate synthase NadA [Kiritimatiellae bacterium]|jgi:quinolinate synthase|nr:quinolinate synthase NadA [Kiritimatiellia bacterium]
MNIKKEILKLKEERNAVILAHNYQLGEVQDIADFTGDSLELARKATDIDSDVIVFCGVHFMAETAAILNTDKTVLLPAKDAGCPMADMITGDQLRELKAKHPKAKVLCYVNSTAEIKAESDCCVTSSNALAVAKSYPADQEIIFVPDRHLGGYTAEQLHREFILWPGFCPTHACFMAEQIAESRKQHPDALVLVHPESPKPVRDAADQVLSTGGMCRFALKSDNTSFIIGTEVGIIHRLQLENPDKSFFALHDRAICPNMKKIDLEKVFWSLKDMETKIVVPEDIAIKAKLSIEKMLSLS